MHMVGSLAREGVEGRGRCKRAKKGSGKDGRSATGFLDGVQGAAAAVASVCGGWLREGGEEKEGRGGVVVKTGGGPGSASC